MERVPRPRGHYSPMKLARPLFCPDHVDHPAVGDAVSRRVVPWGQELRHRQSHTYPERSGDGLSPLWVLTREGGHVPGTQLHPA